MRYFFILFAIAGLLINPSAAEACTGITLKSKDGTTIVARTIESVSYTHLTLPTT